MSLRARRGFHATRRELGMPPGAGCRTVGASGGQGANREMASIDERGDSWAKGMRAEQSALTWAQIWVRRIPRPIRPAVHPDPGTAGPARPGADHRDGQPEGRRW